MNRARIEAIATEHGLAVMRPEGLTVIEQIALFKSADMLVGEYGSALHNAIFAGPGAAVCALRGTARHPSLVQSGIATALGQDVGYVFGSTEGSEGDQAFYVEEANFRLALELMRPAVVREKLGEMCHPPKPPSVINRDVATSRACKMLGGLGGMASFHPAFFLNLSPPPPHASNKPALPKSPTGSPRTPLAPP